MMRDTKHMASPMPLPISAHRHTAVNRKDKERKDWKKEDWKKCKKLEEKTNPQFTDFILSIMSIMSIVIQIYTNKTNQTENGLTVAAFLSVE